MHVPRSRSQNSNSLLGILAICCGGRIGGDVGNLLE